MQLQRSVGKVVFFAKHIDVMDAAEDHFAAAGLRTVSMRGDQTTPARQQAIDAFNNDPGVGIAVCSLTAAGVGLNMQAASNVVLAELSWTAAEQTQAIDRVHRIGQDEPVTAWRIIAAHTIDTKIAELIDSKQGLAAARARRRGRRPAVQRLGAALGAHAPAPAGARRRLSDFEPAAVPARVAGRRHPRANVG